VEEAPWLPLQKAQRGVEDNGNSTLTYPKIPLQIESQLFLGRVVNIFPPVEVLMLTLQGKCISRMMLELWKFLAQGSVFNCSCSF
jgi:hypothetical protein